MFACDSSVGEAQERTAHVKCPHGQGWKGWRQEDEKFKLILAPVKLEASLGYNEILFKKSGNNVNKENKV